MPYTVLAAEQQGSSAVMSVLLYVAIGAAFYFLLIRPQRNRAKMMLQAQASISVGAEVITNAGIYGRVVGENEDDTLLLEIAPGMPIRIARTAILRAISPVADDADAEGDVPPASS